MPKKHLNNHLLLTWRRSTLFLSLSMPFTRRILTWVALVFTLMALISNAARFSKLDWIIWDDYVEYWSASHLNLTRGNPYSPEQIKAVEYAIGRHEKIPLMMWNPPWTLGVILPLALFPYPVSRLLWYLIGIAIILGCASWLWQKHGGERKRLWLIWLLTFTFAPTLHVLKMGQISPLLLLSAVGYWACIQRRKDWAAGALAALALIKPHLLYLFLPAVLVWAMLKRRWGVLWGFGLAIVAATGLAWAINPALMEQYWIAITTYPPEAWRTPTLGGMLRDLFGGRYFWLQFAPSAVGAAWLALYAWKRRTNWNWERQLPLIVLVSVTTAAYGWVFDQTISLAALIPAAVTLCDPRRWRRNCVDHNCAPIRLAILSAVYLAVNLIAAFTSQEQHWYWWMPTFLLLWTNAVWLHRPADLP